MIEQRHRFTPREVFAGSGAALTLVFIILKVLGVVDWSWFAVALPFALFVFVRHMASKIPE